MMIMARSMASGSQVGMLPGVVGESSHLGYNHVARAHTHTPTHMKRGGLGMVGNLLKPQNMYLMSHLPQ